MLVLAFAICLAATDKSAMASAPFGPAEHLNLRKGNLIGSSSYVPQSAPTSLPAGLTPVRFGDTLAANESSFWLGRTSGRHPAPRYTALPNCSLSNRVGGSNLC